MEIYLSFKQAQIVDYLLNRGDALAYGIVWKQIEYEMKIKQHLIENQEDLVTP